MRISFLIFGIIFCINPICLWYYNSVGESFVTIPAWLGYGAITAAVKFKLILVKIMFALKTMGISSIRIKRGTHQDDEKDGSEAESGNSELLAVWSDLEFTVGRKIHFFVESCLEGAQIGETSTTSKTPFVHQTEAYRDTLTITPKSLTKHETDAYSRFVSRIIGLITRNVTGCHILWDAFSNPDNVLPDPI